MWISNIETDFKYRLQMTISNIEIYSTRGIQIVGNMAKWRI